MEQAPKSQDFFLPEMFEAAKAYRRPDETFLANVIEGIGKSKMCQWSPWGNHAWSNVFVTFFWFVALYNIIHNICKLGVITCTWSILEYQIGYTI